MQKQHNDKTICKNLTNKTEVIKISNKLNNNAV